MSCDVVAHVNHVVNTYVKFGLSSASIIASLALHERLSGFNIESTLKDGFSNDLDTQLSWRTMWVEVANYGAIDVGNMIVQRCFSNFCKDMVLKKYPMFSRGEMLSAEEESAVEYAIELVQTGQIKQYLHIFSKSYLRIFNQASQVESVEGVRVCEGV